MDLAALLRQPATEPQTAIATAADPLADHEIILSLRLRPADAIDERQVLGTIGLAGQMPQFVQGTVAFHELHTVLRKLYARIEPALAAATVQAQKADSASAPATLATAPANAKSSMLDIF